MKRLLFAAIVALTLAGCTFPDMDGAAYTPRSSPAATSTTQYQQPASHYAASQPPENTGDYSNYF
jgi:hypothetical protein